MTNRTTPSNFPQFWRHVIRPRNGGCWLWPLSRHCGMGLAAAAQTAWVAEHGALPPDTTIARICATRRCINPAHHQLFRVGNPDNEANVQALRRDWFASGKEVW